MQEILRPEVNHYQLSELIGEGLSSCVYKALRTDSRGLSNQTVALKLLKSQQHIQFLLNEFETLCRVRSPHCVSVLGWENFAKSSALVLEFVEGVSLQQLLEAGPLPVDVVDEVTRQIQLGLEYLRDRKLCHGDLSPGNILIDTQGVVRLVDFGLANWSARENFGTPQFLAPERWQHAPAGPLSDLYSLGLIRHYMNSTISTAELMKLQPDERKPMCIEDHPAARSGLAKRVQHVRHNQVQRPIVTQVLATVPLTTSVVAPAKHSFPWIWAAAVSLAVWGLPATPNNQFRPPVQTPAHLEIRSRSWLEASLNGHNLGYAPIRLPTLSPGLYHLKWRMAHREGVRELDLAAGEHKVLTDADFARKSP